MWKKPERISTSSLQLCGTCFSPLLLFSFPLSTLPRDGPIVFSVQKHLPSIPSPLAQSSRELWRRRAQAHPTADIPTPGVQDRKKRVFIPRSRHHSCDGKNTIISPGCIPPRKRRIQFNCAPKLDSPSVRIIGSRRIISWSLKTHSRFLKKRKPRAVCKKNALLLLAPATGGGAAAAGSIAGDSKILRRRRRNGEKIMGESHENSSAAHCQKVERGRRQSQGFCPRLLQLFELCMGPAESEIATSGFFLLFFFPCFRRASPRPARLKAWEGFEEKFFSILPLLPF